MDNTAVSSAGTTRRRLVELFLGGGLAGFSSLLRISLAAVSGATTGG